MYKLIINFIVGFLTISSFKFVITKNFDFLFDFTNLIILTFILISIVYATTYILHFYTNLIINKPFDLIIKEVNNIPILNQIIYTICSLLLFTFFYNIEIISNILNIKITDLLSYFYIIFFSPLIGALIINKIKGKNNE